MATRSANIAAIEQRTGISWDEWVAWLEAQGAADLPHPRIAEVVDARLRGTVENSGWWAQSVTIAFEQHIGRRVPGQRPDGTFEVSVTTMVAASREDAFARLTAHLDALADVDGQVISDARTSITPKRSYWRCGLADGSTIAAAVEQRGERVQVGVTIARLASPADLEARRAYVRDLLGTVFAG